MAKEKENIYKIGGKMKDLNFKSINWKRVLLTVGIAFIIMLLIAGGYWYWLSKQPAKNASTTSSQSPSTTETTTENQNPDTTQNTSSPVTTGNTTPNTPNATTPRGASNSTPTPPAPTPAPVVFAVTAATAAPDQTSICNNQDNIVNFTGQITANAAGTIHYHWLRSDNGTTGDQTLTFTGAGTKTVTTSWTLPNVTDLPWYLRPFVKTAYAIQFQNNMWEQLIVTSPNSITSNQAGFYSGGCYQ